MVAVCCSELLQHHFNASCWSWRHSRGLYRQRNGEMLRAALPSAPSGHRPTLRVTAARSKMHRMSAGRGRRYTSLKESVTVDGGCIVKTRACFIFSNFGECYWRKAVGHCWDMTAKLSFISTTPCMQTICNMNNSAPNIKMSQCLL